MDNSDIVSMLNDLIETSKDGEYGFTSCAEHAASEELRALFRTRAQDCRAGALELQNLVRECGGKPDEGGSASGAMHRGWVAVFGTIAGTSDPRMLEEAERGEDTALARYRKALRSDDLPPTIRDVIERQMAGVQRNHDQMKALRDRARSGLTFPSSKHRESAMNVSEIMTTDVQMIGPQETLQHAAQLMEQLNVGALPVCDGRRLLGMVTDRDITVRGTAAGMAPGQACVSDVMTGGTEWCTEDQDTEEVMRVMGEAQVRRLPVINAQREVVGIVALGDLATKQPGHVDRTVREISTPSEPDGGAINS